MVAKSDDFSILFLSFIPSPEVEGPGSAPPVVPGVSVVSPVPVPVTIFFTVFIAEKRQYFYDKINYAIHKTYCTGTKTVHTCITNIRPPTGEV